VPEINFIPSTLIDKAFAGGGNPNAAPPQPQPKAPTPAPQAPPVQQYQPPTPPRQTYVEPEPQPIRRTEAGEDYLPKKPAPKKIEPDINTTLTTREKFTRSNSVASSQSQSRSRDLANDRRRAERALGQTLAAIREDTAKTTSIDSNYGPGGGGPTYASYDAYVKYVYDSSWSEPTENVGDGAVVKASVIIGRDGAVRSAQIKEPSGNARLDETVRQTLINVTFIKPFPPEWKEDEREYTILFNINSKRLAG
jgi:TonB family protein